MRLEGLRIVLTGASGGIGSRLSDLLAAPDADLTVIGRSRGVSGAARFVEADLSCAKGIVAASDAVTRLSPDVLVHLAGAQRFGAFETQGALQMLRDYHVNLLAPALLTRAALPGMKERGFGHVLFAGSVFGSIPFAHFASYSSAKAGLAALATALRRECARDNVTFTLATPRAVDTAMATPAIRQFATMAGFSFDNADVVAQRLFRAIAGRRASVSPGFPESVFMRLNALAPSLVGRALARTDRKARSLLDSYPETEGPRS